MDENVTQTTPNDDPQNENQPIGEPQPTLRGELWQFFKGACAIGGTTALAAASVVVFMENTRTSGANRSARLVWEQRQAEIREVIQQQDSIQSSVILSLDNGQQTSNSHKQ
jgi:hypothetical protein